MGVLHTMWDLLTGHRHEARKAEQAAVDHALKVTRESTRDKINGFDREVEGLRGSEARIMAYFNGLQHQAGRSHRGQY